MTDVVEPVRSPLVEGSVRGPGPSARDWSPGVPLRHIAYFDPAPEPVPNPGQGLCLYVHSDHMYLEPTKPHARLTVDRKTLDAAVAPYPGHHLYLRVEWRDVQSEAGRLHLPDHWRWAVETAERYGMGWSFRIMPSCPQSLFAHSTPDFLRHRLQFWPYPNRKFPGPAVKHMPQYDAVYLAHWRELLELLAQECDGHPNLEFVDISGFGKWGEWHHWPESEIDGGDHRAAMMALVNMHLDAFRQTPAVMPMLLGDARRDEVLAYALARGCGLRRDSFYPLFTPWECRVARDVRHPGTPWVFEPGWFPEVRDTQPGAPPMDFPTLCSRLLDLGISHLGLGFNPWHALAVAKSHPATLELIRRRLGYRLRPAIVWLTRTIKREPKRLVVALRNDGECAPAGAVRLQVAFEGGPCVRTALTPGCPAAGAMQIVEFPLPDDFAAYGGGGAAQLTATLGFGAKERPLRWAVSVPGCSGGAASLAIPVPAAIEST